MELKAIEKKHRLPALFLFTLKQDVSSQKCLLPSVPHEHPSLEMALGPVSLESAPGYPV